MFLARRRCLKACQRAGERDGGSRGKRTQPQRHTFFDRCQLSNVFKLMVKEVELERVTFSFS